MKYILIFLFLLTTNSYALDITEILKEQINNQNKTYKQIMYKCAYSGGQSYLIGEDKDYFYVSNSPFTVVKGTTDTIGLEKESCNYVFTGVVLTKYKGDK